jgi:hypothetical protein
MGTASTERVAFLIETHADLSGVQAVRKETTALGREAEKARNEAVAGEQKVTLSLEQTRRAAAEAGGDFSKLQQILARMVSEENALAEAARKAATEMDRQQRIARQAGAAPLGPFPSGPAQGPRDLGPLTGSSVLGPAGRGPDIIGPQFGPALPGLSTAAAAAASARVQLEKIPPAARSSANALSVLAQAAATGDGSVRGLAGAAASAVQGMALMSSNAKVAASAAGIGALAVAVGTLVGLAIEAKRALEEIPEGALSRTAQEHIENLKTQKQVAIELALVEDQIHTARERITRGDEEGLKRVVDLEAKRSAYLVRSRAITLESREAAEKASREEDARERERVTQRKAANDQLYELRNAAAEAADKATQAEYEQKRRAIERQAANERRANEELIQSDSMRAQALQAINDKREYSLKLLEREAELTKKRLVAEGLAGYAKLSAAVKNHGTLVGAVAKAAADAVRLHEIYVAGKKAAISAKIEWAAAMAAFGSGNAAGGALHLAASAGYGAAAVAAGAEAAQSVSGGSGGGGGDAGATGGGTTFQDRGASGGGNVTIVLQTVNNDGEIISEALYQLNRGEHLKRPVPTIAPTRNAGLSKGGFFGYSYGG